MGLNPFSNLFLITCDFPRSLLLSLSSLLFFPWMESDEGGWRRSKVTDDRKEGPNLRGKKMIGKEWRLIFSLTTTPEYKLSERLFFRLSSIDAFDR